MRKKILLIIDMQNDFLTGSLGAKDKHNLASDIANFIEKNKDYHTIFTMDTHIEGEKSVEFSKLPSHCVKESNGWNIADSLAKYSNKENTIYKKSYMAGDNLTNIIKSISPDDTDIFLCGVCTDICVISNALLLRRDFPNSEITIIENLCLGTNDENHKSAINVLKSCLFNIVKL